MVHAHCNGVSLSAPLSGGDRLATLNRHALKNDLKYFDNKGIVKTQNTEKGIQAGFGAV
jgi:hypothetical protein